ncbi:HlyD family efflux transporter periplasmic adaptor subunit [Xanthomonas campestris pv. cannae]|nr:HlyD family efflux transporter periplasmic adaptor subunit [Xanthomonas campestris pv. cannae]
MNSSLFRSEVYENRRSALVGSISLRAPRIGWAFMGFGMCAVLAIALLLAFGQYTRREPVSGTLVPSDGLLTVAAPATGSITRVFVREGERVRAGQPLLEVSETQSSASKGDVGVAVSEQLAFKREKLLDDLSGQDRLAGMQRRDIRQRIRLLEAQIRQVDDQATLQAQRAKDAMALYEQWSKYQDSGVVSKQQILTQHDQALQHQAQLMDLRRQGYQLHQQLSELQGQADQLPETVAGRSNETQRELSDVAQLIAKNAAQHAALLKSPVDGTVTSAPIYAGQSVVAEQPMVAVLPAESTLQAELWVPTQAVGFIRKGEEVVIRYRAYPYQKFGQYVGRVQQVSRSSLSPSEANKATGKDIKESSYRVLVHLENQHVQVYGRPEALRPGMTLDADILLDRRRLFEWLFDPLYGFGRRSIEDREHG